MGSTSNNLREGSESLWDFSLFARAFTGAIALVVLGLVMTVRDTDSGKGGYPI